MLKKLILAGVLTLLPGWGAAQFSLPVTLICEHCDLAEIEEEMLQVCSYLKSDESGGLVIMDAATGQASKYVCEIGSLIRSSDAVSADLVEAFNKYLSHWRPITASLKEGHQLPRNRGFDDLEDALDDQAAFEEAVTFSLMKDPVFADHVQGVSTALNSIRRLRKMPAYLKLANQLEPFESSVLLADGSALPFTLFFLSSNMVIFEVKVRFDEKLKGFLSAEGQAK